MIAAMKDSQQVREQGVRQGLRAVRRGDEDGEEGEDLPPVRQEQMGEQGVLHRLRCQRNDMVEYFGEQLSGFAFTANGSRCVKSPIIYGDVSCANPMTVFWWIIAQSMLSRPMKGMLTGLRLATRLVMQSRRRLRILRRLVFRSSKLWRLL